MIRHPLLRVFAVLGALASGIAACFLVALAVEAHSALSDQVRPDSQVLLFLPMAEERDVTALGGSLAAEHEAALRWRVAHPQASIDEFNRLEREVGGPIRGLAWYPARRSSDAERPGADLVPVLIQLPEWTFTAADLDSIGPTNDEIGYPAVAFELVPARREEFGDFTESLVGRQLAIIHSGEVLTRPVVQSRLPGKGIINGGTNGFTVDEVKRIVRTLRSVEGSLTTEALSLEWLLFVAAAVAMLLLATALLVLFFVSLRASQPKSPETWSDRTPA